jgi:hypothetical protein
VLEGLDEVGGGGGSDRAYCFCEVEAGDASFVAEAFDHLLELYFVGGGVEGFVDYLVADCFVEGVGFFGVEGFSGLGHEEFLGDRLSSFVVVVVGARFPRPHSEFSGDTLGIVLGDMVGGVGRGKRALTGWWVRG